MRPSQIIAIARVALEAPPGAKDRLIWFYRDLVGLTFIEDTLNHSLLRFRSGQLELHVLLCDQPRIEQIRRQAVVSVESLEATMQTLQEERIPFERLFGVNWSDRRVGLLDPGGNRVELKQEWRRGVFPTAQERARLGRRGSAEQAGPKKFQNSADTDGQGVYSVERSESGRS